jgi:hypothetical protein
VVKIAITRGFTERLQRAVVQLTKTLGIDTAFPDPLFSAQELAKIAQPKRRKIGCHFLFEATNFTDRFTKPLPQKFLRHCMSRIMLKNKRKSNRKELRASPRESLESKDKHMKSSRQSSNTDGSR